MLSPGQSPRSSIRIPGSPRKICSPCFDLIDEVEEVECDEVNTCARQSPENEPDNESIADLLALLTAQKAELRSAQRRRPHWRIPNAKTEQSSFQSSKHRKQRSSVVVATSPPPPWRPPCGTPAELMKVGRLPVNYLEPSQMQASPRPAKTYEPRTSPPFRETHLSPRAFPDPPKRPSSKQHLVQAGVATIFTARGGSSPTTTGFATQLDNMLPAHESPTWFASGHVPREFDKRGYLCDRFRSSITTYRCSLQSGDTPQPSDLHQDEIHH